MAPSRRKGPGKPAKAADNRQWNVGDLVLAKVKGFQAWPAVVSEPEKWGYSADWKKVLVYFFGTKQIAFCNPAEIEAFTEEKKNTLLSKRHGRGSDFFRAIKEIVDMFDNSRKCHDNSNASSKINEIMEEAAAMIALNSPYSCNYHDESEKPPETPMETLNLRLKTVTANDTSGACSPAENVDDELCGEGSCDGGSLSCKFTDKIGISAVMTDHVDLKEDPAARITISSSSPDVSKLYNAKESCSNGDMIPTEHKKVQDSMQSLQSPFSTDTNLPNFDANSAIVEHVSETTVVELDPPSSAVLNMPDSCDKSEKHDLLVDEKASSNQDSVVLKKKRKQNSKLVKKELSLLSCEVTVGTNTGAEEDTMCSSIASSKILNEKCPKEDSDEHLPLLKRARVRMGKPPSSDYVPLAEVCNHNLAEVNSSLSIFDPIICNGDTNVVNSVTEISSFSNSFPKEVEYTNPYPNKKCDHSSICSIDAESTLPPSKRLHRALEAMSANISEDGEILLGHPPSGSDFLHDACHFAIPLVMGENKNRSGLLTNEVELINNNTSSIESFGICNLKSPEAPGAISSYISTDNGFPHTASSNDLNQFLSNELQTEDVTDQSRRDLLIEEAEITFMRDPPNEILERVNSPSRSDTNPTAIVSNPNMEGLHQREDVSVNSLPDTKKENDTCVVSKELCRKSCIESNNTSLSSSDIGDNTSLNSIKRCISSSSTFIAGPDIYKSDESFPDISSTTSPTTNMKSSGEEFLFHSSSSCDKFYKRDNSFNSSSQRDRFFGSSKEGSGYLAQVLAQKPKMLTNYSSLSNANAALKSFRTIIRSLTRTKEIIGRATRVALDCAKFGFASKVVEIIACSLETESKLHKRVDLLFLVDSIIQCSRAMKDEIGGVYLSTMELALPRLLVAAAPPGNAARENHKQCQKVLRIWLERKIFPEATVRNLVQQLNCLTNCSSLSLSSGLKRALNDPVREMDMLVDEYGSNSSFQLPNYRIPRVLGDNDSGSDSDGGKFEAVTPEHNSKISEEPKIIDRYYMEKHCRILEDVDGELEMEDVAPFNEVGENCNVPETFNTSDGLTNRSEKSFKSSFPPPLPTDVPPSSPPLPSSPPPAVPPVFSPHPCQSFSFPENRSYYEHPHTFQNDTERSVVQTEGASSSSLSYWPNSDPINCHGYENSDFPIQSHISEPSISHPIEHSPVVSSNVAPSVESGSSFYNKKASLLKPPLPVPSNHFSYVHKHVPRAERQHDFYPSRQKTAPFDRYMNIYSDIDIIKPVESCSPGERWRQACVDDDKVSAFFYMESENNHFIRSQGRPFPPRRFDYRDFPPFHSRFESAFSTYNRASRYWQQMRRRRW